MRKRKGERRKGEREKEPLPIWKKKWLFFLSSILSHYLSLGEWSTWSLSLSLSLHLFLVQVTRLELNNTITAFKRRSSGVNINISVSFLHSPFLLEFSSNNDCLSLSLDTDRFTDWVIVFRVKRDGKWVRERDGEMERGQGRKEHRVGRQYSNYVMFVPLSDQLNRQPIEQNVILYFSHNSPPFLTFPFYH